MKIQINLYEHREKDKEIMQKLGLDKSANPNATVRDLLYKLAMDIEVKPIETKKSPPRNEKKEKQTTVNNKLIAGMQGLI